MQTIETLSLDEARVLLREYGLGMDKTVLADGIEQGVFPFGLCIRTNRSRVFKIFKRLLLQWVSERAGGLDE